MNWKQHLTYGLMIEFVVLIVLLVYNIVPTPTLSSYAILIFVLIISPLTPDLDHENGKLRDWLLKIGALMSLTGLFLYIVYPFLNSLLFVDLGFLNGLTELFIPLGIILFNIPLWNAEISHHRGFWHSLSMNFILSLIMFYFIGFFIGILFFVGFWSHLVCDEIPFKLW